MKAQLPQIARTFNQGFGAALQRSGATISSIGAKLTQGLTVPLGIAAVAAGKLGVDFETSLARIQGLVRIDARWIRRFHDEILVLSREVGIMPRKLADALYFITSSGVPAAKAMDLLRVSAHAAAAGLGETTQIADAVTSALNAYAKTGLTAAHVTDVLIAAVREGKAEPAELATSIGYAIPVAASLGVTFDEVAGSLAAVTLAGYNTHRAAQALRFLLSSLLGPTEKAKKVFAGLGLSLEELHRMLRVRGLLNTLTFLRKELSAEDFKTAVGGVRALTLALDLTGQNAAKVRRVFREVTNSTGDLNAAFDVAADTTRFKMRRALAVLSTAGINIGSRFLPALGRAAEGVSNLGDSFGRLSPHTQDMVVQLGLLAIAAGPVLRVIGGLARNVGALIVGIRTLGTVAGAGTGLTGVLGGLGVAALVLVPLAAGLSALADAHTDVHKIGKELGFTADQIAAIQKNIQQGGPGKSFSNFLNTLQTGLTGGFDKATIAAFKAVGDLYRDLVRLGVPAAVAQERVNIALRESIPLLDGTGDGLRDFRAGLRRVAGAALDAEGKIKLNNVGLRAIGDSFIASSAAAKLWGEIYNRAAIVASAIGRENVGVTAEQAETLARLVQQISNANGFVNESQKRWLAVYLASGQYNKALKLLRAELRQSRKALREQGEAAKETGGKIRTARDAAEEYDARLRALPLSVRTTILAQTTQAERDIERYRAILYSLPSTIDTTLYVTPRIKAPEYETPKQRRAREKRQGAPPPPPGSVPPRKVQAGAILTRPTMITPYAMGGEGKSDEGVIPFDKRGRAILGEQMKLALEEVGAKRGDTHINIYGVKDPHGVSAAMRWERRRGTI
jgi:TP901 family phage tail tape measure protein